MKITNIFEEFCYDDLCRSLGGTFHLQAEIPNERDSGCLGNRALVCLTNKHRESIVLQRSIELNDNCRMARDQRWRVALSTLEGNDMK